MMNWRSAAVGMTCILGSFACSLVVGCGQSGPKTIPVSGQVTYQGTAVPAGLIVFLPASDMECRPGRAFVQSDGSYRATTVKKGDGLMAGEYRVSIMPAPLPNDVAQKKGSGPGGSNGENRPTPTIPSRYGSPETSGLKLTVDASASSVTFDMPLTDG
ncbi:MAG: hypothetical protein IT427_08665 [Pirellulales bacterium]|nr:hypothetical protein [Pirellulales bacterium]